MPRVAERANAILETWYSGQEGGTAVHTRFLTAGLADEAHLVVAPFFVGDSRAPRFVGDGAFPWHSGRRATLVEVRQIGDVVLLRYALSDRYGSG